MKLDTQVVGNIGMYYSCYKLSRMGWNVMPTARNAKGVDIIAYNSKATEYIGVQVKTLSRHVAVPLGNSLEKVMGDYWVIITGASGEPTTFVLLPQEVKELATFNDKNGKRSYWLSRKQYDQEQFRGAWHRIGQGAENA